MAALRAVWRRSSAVLLPAILGLLAGVGAAQDRSPSLEAKVKAAFLFNFAKFVQWQASPGPSDGPFVIGVLGEGPVLSALSALDGQEVHGRRLAIRTYARTADVNCQILFVGPGQLSDFSRDIERIHEREILTVGEGDEFLRAGGMIALVRVNGNVRYRINLGAVQSAHLSISSKVLKLADRIEEFGGPQ